jgi:gliding motility-associated-like protein
MKQMSILIISLFTLCAWSLPASAQKPLLHAQTEPAKQELLIPNAFTPNNDGQNDYFRIINFTNQKLIELKIFNRWGTILFQTKNPKEGWNGKFKDQLQPLGVYGYVIRIAYPESEVIETYKGTVTLLR